MPNKLEAWLACKKMGSSTVPLSWSPPSTAVPSSFTLYPFFLHHLLHYPKYPNSYKQHHLLHPNSTQLHHPFLRLLLSPLILCPRVRSRCRRWQRSAQPLPPYFLPLFSWLHHRHLFHPHHLLHLLLFYLHNLLLTAATAAAPSVVISLGIRVALDSSSSSPLPFSSSLLLPSFSSSPLC